MWVGWLCTRFSLNCDNKRSKGPGVGGGHSKGYEDGSADKDSKGLGAGEGAKGAKGPGAGKRAKGAKGSGISRGSKGPRRPGGLGINGGRRGAGTTNI